MKGKGNKYRHKTSLSASATLTTSSMSAAVSSLVSYGSNSDSEDESETKIDAKKVDPNDPDATAHLKPLQQGHTMSVALLNSAPEVAVKVG